MLFKSDQILMVKIKCKMVVLKHFMIEEQEIPRTKIHHLGEIIKLELIKLCYLPFTSDRIGYSTALSRDFDEDIHDGLVTHTRTR